MSKLIQSTGRYLLADNVRAAMFALGCALLAFFFPIGFIVTLILGLVTLQKGYKASLVILAFVLLPAIALVVTQHFSFFYRFNLLLIQCSIVFTFALILRYTASWQLVLEVAAAVGVLLIGMIHIIFPDIRRTWVGLINDYFLTNTWTSTFHLSTYSTEFVQHLATIATGGFIFFVFFDTIILLILARWWQTTLFSPGTLQLEFTRIRISKASASLLIIASVGLIWQSNWLTDIYPVLLFPFMIGGLSLLHLLVMNKREMVLLIAIVYIALFLLTFFTTIILAIIGLVDSFYNFRKHCILFQSR
ncbi:hypothetical protein [Coxiella-like endosymbiont of Amblyomma americanum]|uniref:hypothetical protein n=1 Tax=Coxiella-like endosymbiont of Amblyomma americanum TaxID=1987500 RepID=UPI001E4310E2|nr:hypothetical protein [Coxiella-like endosymbiont of Amblyomma americanum]